MRSLPYYSSVSWRHLNTYVCVSPDSYTILILGKLEGARIPYAFTSVLHFFSYRMTSGITSDAGLVYILHVLMIARWP